MSETCMCYEKLVFYIFFTNPATDYIYSLSLHDALPISRRENTRDHPRVPRRRAAREPRRPARDRRPPPRACNARSEEHTSELQSHVNLVCRLLLEKKKNSYF